MDNVLYNLSSIGVNPERGVNHSYKKNHHPVVAVFTHKDGTVSVGISGSVNNKDKQDKNKEIAKYLEQELNKDGKNKYRVSGEPIDIGEIERPTNEKGEEKGNPKGQCAEPKAAKAASQINSEIDGFDVVWRGKKGKNNYKPENVSEYFKEGDYEQMNPCDTCADPHNINAYMRNANKNK